MITSFLIETLRRVQLLGWSSEKIRLVNPLVLRSIGGVESIWRIAREGSFGGIAFHQEAIDARTLDAVLAQGLRLGAYATHEDDAIHLVLGLGITTFTTDRPTSAFLTRDRRSQFYIKYYRNEAAPAPVSTDIPFGQEADLRYRLAACFGKRGRCCRSRRWGWQRVAADHTGRGR